MNTYQNPISERDHELLSILQSYAARRHAIEDEGAPSRAIRETHENAHALLKVAIGDQHPEALNDAFWGRYDARDPRVPFNPDGYWREPGTKAPAEKALDNRIAELANETGTEEPVNTAADAWDNGIAKVFTAASDEGRTRPEDVFSSEELRRFYAVQAAGQIPARVDGADLVAMVADWILGGGPATD